jgi:hypothetical protein
MAQLNSRGTLTRGRWDYFEHSNGWASVYGSVTSGGIGAYFANNSTATMQLDIYALYWFASVASVWNVGLFPPPLILTAFAPTEVEIHASQPDRAQLAGVCGMYSAAGSPFLTIQRISNSLTSGIIQPVAGEPFIALPPNWAISVSGFGGGNPIELSMNVWYQEIIDNVSPAN